MSVKGPEWAPLLFWRLAWKALQEHHREIRDLHLRPIFANASGRRARLCPKAAGLQRLRALRGYDVVRFDRPPMQTLIYLPLSVAGHLTIFLTRTRGPFWSIRPALALWAAVLGTQVIATLIAAYGLFMTPLRWSWALFMSGCLLVWFLLIRCAGWLLVPLALAFACGALAAQDATRADFSCEGGIVSAIHVTPHDPSFLVVPRSVRALARAVGVLHTTTRAETIGSFLLLEVGQRCTERNRAESERVLRLQPFLADAAVRAFPDGRGGVRIEVETIDEIPTVFDMRFHGVSPSALRLGNGNVAGQGLYVAAKVERGFAYRTGVGVSASPTRCSADPTWPRWPPSARPWAAR